MGLNIDFIEILKHKYKQYVIGYDEIKNKYIKKLDIKCRELVFFSFLLVLPCRIFH